MDRDAMAVLIEGSELNGLVRFIDGLCRERDWAGLVELRDRCVEAVDRGKQVWGAAQFAEYRMALEAPGELAGTVVVEGAGRFSLGPLWEVAASTHTWSELADHIASPTQRTMAAHERVLRGEDLRGADVDRQLLDVPLALEPWEPRYPVAVYRSDRADFPESDLPPMEWVDLGNRGTPLEDPADDVLQDLVRPWVEESSGRSQAVTVEGSASTAVRTLGPHRARMTEVSFPVAIGAMAWAAASGGAYGRRRGSPVGRLEAWYATAAVLGLDEDWPIAPSVLGEEGSTLRWFLWDPGDRVGGWNLHIAVEDPETGLSRALSAVDAR